MTDSIKELLDFFRIRRKVLHLIMTQVDFNGRIKDKREAKLLLKSKLKEIERICRKLDKTGLKQMTEDEEYSFDILYKQKTEQVKEVHQ